ncbi:hypothetical protein [Acinetobacter indicus]|uniref:hypothetical protein n=1 Tax=Acinetobacter indicus TaxID=756892 RepID=UPI003989B133
MKTLLIAALFTTLSLPAWADVQCSGSLKDRSISDNIFVGKQCTLINVQVDGNVMLADGAKAILRNSHIDGNLESKGRFAQLVATNNRIEGNIQLERGKLTQLHNNRVNGNLECENNATPPVGGRNTVQGDKTGQCRRL